jgi:hypothetical protein
MSFFSFLSIAVGIPVMLASGCGQELDQTHESSRESLENPYSKPSALNSSYIVNFRVDDPSSRSRRGFRSFAAEQKAFLPYLEAKFLGNPLVKRIQLISVVDLSPQAENPAEVELFWGVGPQLSKTKEEYVPGLISRVDFHEGHKGDIQAELRAWKSRGEIWYAEPNFISQLSQDNKFQTLSTDYQKINHWWQTAINLSTAYQSIGDRNQGDANVPTDQEIVEGDQPIIAVLDSGVDYSHPALSGRIWTNPDVNSAKCEDDTHGCNTTVFKRGKLGNGKVYPFDTDGPGQSCAGRDPNCSHGTHVAGIIAAEYDPEEIEAGTTPAGVCPVCKIMILKIVSKIGKSSGILDSSILAAFKYVTLFKRKNSPTVRVINASFGKFSRSRSVGLLVRLMKSKNQTLLVAASGNEDTLTMEYPAAFSDSIAVAAVDRSLRKGNFSNFGRWVDIAAPGTGIVSTIPGGLADAKSGTSMASPVVAGVAGLILAVHPRISFDELRNAVLLSADPSFYGANFEGGYNYHHYYPKVKHEKIRQPLLGTGLLDANRAVLRKESDGLPVFSDLDRVKRGCSTISSGIVGTEGLLWVFLLIPFVVTRRFRINARLTRP